MVLAGSWYLVKSFELAWPWEEADQCTVPFASIYGYIACVESIIREEVI